MARLSHWVACVGVLGSVIMGTQLPASAEGEQDVVTETSTLNVSESQIQTAMTDAGGQATALENQAVSDYLEDLPSQGSELTANDLQVGTFEITSEMDAVVVVPEANLEMQHIDVWVDSGSNEVGASANLELSDAAPLTSGAGMGSWPAWEVSPSYVLELRLYSNGNFVGKAEFQSQRRKYSGDGHDGPNGYDLWQVARRAKATPDEVEIAGAPDVNANVKKLWISSQLQSGSTGYAQQWRQDFTNPEEGFSNCTTASTGINAGPFNFTPKDCAEYDVWQGAVGHQRFDFDQGAVASGGTRSIAYVSGFQMDQDRVAKMDWYEFVTLRLGKYAGQPLLKCPSEERGIEGGTQTLACHW